MKCFHRSATRCFGLLLFLLFPASAYAQREYGFDNSKPSGQPYLAPEETVQRMQAPAGFRVELFAGEPLLTNPIAFTVDAQGRVWVIESFEYPTRTPAGRMPRDRIVILEDTTGDGRADRRTVFAEGKDFPKRFDLASGIEVGHGGCFVGAPPYLWHLKDTNGDGKADQFDILLEGFGSQDTHETLNTFTWGPDGWLYGLHGVFTHSKVSAPAVADLPAGPVEIDAGVWRFHPKSKKFEVFAEGTSNPWGMDFDANGNCFLCCCVIPHLFHIVPGGIYRRQAGVSKHPYAFGELREICDHTFHKESGWAHAGLLVLDTPAMPEEYRTSVIFGSIHGNSLKRNVLRPHESTFVASKAPDFLTCSDKNFRPVGLRWGPNASIFVSDWHDQNPCHQAKPDSWDYERGRIYRIVRTPAVATPDANPLASYRAREAALDQTPHGRTGHELHQRLAELRKDADQKRALTELHQLLAQSQLAADPIHPFLLWLAYENHAFSARPHSTDHVVAEAEWLLANADGNSLLLEHIVPRFFRRWAVSASPNRTGAAALIATSDSEQFRVAALQGLVAGVRANPPVSDPRDFDLTAMLRAARGEERKLLQTLDLLVNAQKSRPELLRLVGDAHAEPALRILAMQQLAGVQEPAAVEPLVSLISSAASEEFKLAALEALAEFTQPDLARRLLPRWQAASPAVRRELLNFATSRREWARDLLSALGDQGIPRTEISDSLILRLRTFNDHALDDLIEKRWGRFRSAPAEMEAQIRDWEVKLRGQPGVAERGKLVFGQRCAQCHRYEGAGHEVGPDLDGADRSVNYLLVNILDPNRVVGLPYQARIVLLKNGKLVTGLLVAEDDQTLTLKKEGALREVIRKADVEEQKTSEASLMPEGLEKQLSESEFRDLIEYLRRK